MSMRIATWNVNSVKAREARVVGWLREHEPDALCLQELKTTDEAYPSDAVRAAGYDSAVLGQRTYNGVALVSRHPISDVARGFGDAAAGLGDAAAGVGDAAAGASDAAAGVADDLDSQARLIRGTVRGVTVYSAYFPNGRTVGSDPYRYKLAWMGRLLEALQTRHDPGDPVVLAGDFNVAPTDQDAENPEQWAASVLCDPATREALERIREWGFVDVVQKHNPQGKLYSWWDYRRLAFPKNDGLRIDHVFATLPVAEASTAAWVDRNQRKGKKTDKPSDHAPVVAEFDL